VTTVVVTDQEVVVTDPEMDLVVVDRPWFGTTVLFGGVCVLDFVSSLLFEKPNQNFSTSVPKYNKNSELASKILNGIAKFTDYQQEKFTDMGSGNRKHVPSLTKNDPKNISSTTNDLHISLSYHQEHNTLV
jgi:hypothetical protein